MAGADTAPREKSVRFPFPVTPILTEEENIALIQQYRATCDQAIRDRLSLQFVKLVWSIASGFIETGEPIEDLFQVGFIGLLSAIDSFDPNHETKLSTYGAYFIIGSIKHHLRDKGKTIKVAAWFQEKIQHLDRLEAKLAAELQRGIKTTDLLERSPMDEDDILKMQAARSSLFAPISIETGHSSRDDDGDGLGHIADQEGNLDPEILAIGEYGSYLSALDELPPRQRDIIKLRCLADLSFTEIAHRSGCSVNNVCLLYSRGLKKLRLVLLERIFRVRIAALRQGRQLSAEDIKERDLLVAKLAPPPTQAFKRHHASPCFDRQPQPISQERLQQVIEAYVRLYQNLLRQERELTTALATVEKQGQEIEQALISLYHHTASSPYGS